MHKLLRKIQIICRNWENIVNLWAFVLSKKLFIFYTKFRNGENLTSSKTSLAVKNHEIIKNFIPKQLLPLTISYEDFVNTKNEKVFIKKIQKELYRYLSQRFKNFALEKNKKELSKFVAIITDGTRVLGLGDQKEAGMWVCFNKTFRYVVHTNGDLKKIINIILHYGIQKPQPPLYRSFIKTVIKALDGIGVLHFEDINITNSHIILKQCKKYITKSLYFHDDIEITALVVISALINLEEKYNIQLNKSLILVLGAGGVASGIAKFVKFISHDNDKIYFFDSKGLLHITRNDLHEYQKELKMITKDPSLEGKSTLEKVIITKIQQVGKEGTIIIIGTTGNCGVLDNNKVKKIYNILKTRTKNPLVLLPLSVPLYKNEILNSEQSKNYLKASSSKKNQILQKAIVDLYKATNGNVLIAFGPQNIEIVYNKKQINIPAANNFLLFPAVAQASLKNINQLTNRERFLFNLAVFLSKSTEVRKDKTNDNLLLPFTKKINKLQILSQKITKMSSYEQTTNIFSYLLQPGMI